MQELGYNYSNLIISTLTRAKETAAIIQDSLPKDIQVTFCSLLEEGAPIPPEPPVGHWRPEAHVTISFNFIIVIVLIIKFIIRDVLQHNYSHVGPDPFQTHLSMYTHSNCIDL